QTPAASSGVGDEEGDRDPEGTSAGEWPFSRNRGEGVDKRLQREDELKASLSVGRSVGRFGGHTTWFSVMLSLVVNSREDVHGEHCVYEHFAYTELPWTNKMVL
ncbi:MAG: hypothetical protein WC618_06125, partial [Patescibacteria group bacterium]